MTALRPSRSFPSIWSAPVIRHSFTHHANVCFRPIADVRSYLLASLGYDCFSIGPFLRLWWRQRRLKLKPVSLRVLWIWQVSPFSTSTIANILCSGDAKTHTTRSLRANSFGTLRAVIGFTEKSEPGTWIIRFSVPSPGMWGRERTTLLSFLLCLQSG